MEIFSFDKKKKKESTDFLVESPRVIRLHAIS